MVEVAVGEQCAQYQDGFGAVLRLGVDAFVRQMRYPVAAAP